MAAGPAPPDAEPANHAISGGSSTEWVIEAVGVKKKYCRDLRRSLWYGVRDVAEALLPHRSPSAATLREHEFWAVDDVSFRLRRGESMGLLGRNGAGKSTLLKLITGQRALTEGTVTTRGRIVALTELGLGFNPVLTGRENAYINAAVLGMARSDFDGIVEKIIDFAGIRDFIDSAVQTYSTGMKARLGFSVAAHLEPDILIVDEVLSVGDLEFRRKCVRYVLEYLRRGGSILLVAHDPYLVQSICTRCLILDRGKCVFDGSGIDGVNFHFHLINSGHFESVATPAGSGGDAADSSGPDVEPTPAEREKTTAARRPRIELTDETPIAIVSIEVLPSHGGELATGCAALVVMRYRSRVSMKATWGFTVCTADLQINIASCATGMDNDATVIEMGENELVCRLPELPLLPGVYAIRGGIGDAESLAAIAVLGYADRPEFFSVTGGQVSRANNFKMNNNDLIALRTEWVS